MEILFSNIEDVEETTETEETPPTEPEEETPPQAPREEEPREAPRQEERREAPRQEERREAPREEERREVPPSEPRPSILKVSSRSRPSAVAGAIAGVVRERGRAEVQSIGAGATNQAVKAVAIARSYLEEDGIDIVCIPGFVEVMIDGEERTAMRLNVEQTN